MIGPRDGGDLIDKWDWQEELRQRQINPIRGTQVTPTQQTDSSSPICGRNVDQSVVAGAQNGIAIAAGGVTGLNLSSNPYPATPPSFQTAPHNAGSTGIFDYIGVGSGSFDAITSFVINAPPSLPGQTLGIKPPWLDYLRLYAVPTGTAFNTLTGVGIGAAKCDITARGDGSYASVRIQGMSAGTQYDIYLAYIDHSGAPNAAVLIGTTASNPLSIGAGLLAAMDPTIKTNGPTFSASSLGTVVNAAGASINQPANITVSDWAAGANPVWFAGIRIFIRAHGDATSANWQVIGDLPANASALTYSTSADIASGIAWDIGLAYLGVNPNDVSKVIWPANWNVAAQLIGLPGLLGGAGTAPSVSSSSVSQSTSARGLMVRNYVTFKVSDWTTAAANVPANIDKILVVVRYPSDTTNEPSLASTIDPRATSATFDGTGATYHTFVRTTGGDGVDIGIKYAYTNGKESSVTWPAGINNVTDPNGDFPTAGVRSVVNVNGQLLAGEFSGGTQNVAGGAFTNVHNAVSTTTVKTTSGNIVTAEAVIAKNNLAFGSGLCLGSRSTNGYYVAYDSSGNVLVQRVVSGTATTIIAAVALPGGNDTGFHSFQLTVQFGASNIVEAVVDQTNLGPFVDSSPPAISNPTGVQLDTGDNNGKLADFQLRIGNTPYTIQPPGIKNVVNSNGQLLASDFPGGTQNVSGGYFTNVDGATSTTSVLTNSTVNGNSVTCRAIIAKGATGAQSYILLGNASNNYVLYFSAAGHIGLSKSYGGVGANFADQVITDTTAQKTFQLTVKFNASNNVVEGIIDGVTFGPFTDSTNIPSMPSPSSVTILTAGSNGKLYDFELTSGQLTHTGQSIGVQTLVTPGGGHNATDYFGAVEAAPGSTYQGYTVFTGNSYFWEKTATPTPLSVAPLCIETTFKYDTNNDFGIFILCQGGGVGLNTNTGPTTGYLLYINHSVPQYSIYRYVGGSNTGVASQPQGGMTTTGAEHHLKIVAYAAGASTIIWMQVDNFPPMVYTDTSGYQTGSYGFYAAGGGTNLLMRDQVVSQSQTDAQQMIAGYSLLTIGGGHNATDFTGIVELSPSDANAGFWSNTGMSPYQSFCWEKSGSQIDISKAPAVIDYTFRVGTATECGFIICADTHPANAEPANAYLFEILNNTTSYIYKRVAGTYTALVGVATPALTAGEHTARCMAYYDGNAVNLIMSVDGVYIASWRETTNIFSTGYYGFRTTNGTVLLRDVNVRQSLSDATSLNPLAGTTTNLQPDSDFRFGTGSYFPVDTLWKLVANPNGGGGNAISVTGTGSAQTGYCFVKPVQPLKANVNYVFSATVDLTAWTGGSLLLRLLNYGVGSVQYASIYLATGMKGRVQGSFSVGSDVTDACITPQLSSAVITNGSKIYISECQVEAGVIATQYMPSGASLGSTPLNNQGSLVPQAGMTTTPSYTSTTSSITVTTPSYTYTRADGSTVTVPAVAGQVFSSLSASTTYYFNIYYVIATNTVTIVNAGTTYTPSTNIVPISDGRLPIYINYAGATTSSGSGGGGGVKPPPDSCPATYQLIETLECGFIRADELQVGYHLRDPFDGWNTIYKLQIKPCTLWRVVTENASIDVNDTHAHMLTSGEWIVVTDIKAGMLLKGGNGKPDLPVVDCYEVGPGEFVAITCENHRYELCGIGHNITL